MIRHTINSCAKERRKLTGAPELGQRIAKVFRGDYRPKGNPQRANVHDFEDKKLGKVVPYGVYDVAANAGFVSVGITSDTAEFAVQSIRCWWDDSTIQMRAS